LDGAAGGKNLPFGPPKRKSSMLPQYQTHEEDNFEAAERREQRLIELLRKISEMQRGMSAQIEALKAQVVELQSPSSRRPEQKGLSHRPEPLRIPPTRGATPRAGNTTQPDAPVKNTQADGHPVAQTVPNQRDGGEPPASRGE